MKIAIVDYGAGNIQSLQFAFNRLGVESKLTNDKTLIKNAERVIFPGVGQASSAMKMLKASGLDKLLPTLEQPVLGICLGMQLMCNYTEEGDTKGLAIFDVEVKRFNNKLKVPQIGWNKIFKLKSTLFNEIDEGAYMYSVHSYYALKNEQSIALTNYQIDYASAIQNKNFYGCQFHPEKSSDIGSKFLKNFLEL